MLSDARRSFKSAKLRGVITVLHAYHRTTYMGERVAYSKRCLDAVNNPVEYLSTIADGMGTNHTKVPWQGNLKEGLQLAQHLQVFLNSSFMYIAISKNRYI